MQKNIKKKRREMKNVILLSLWVLMILRRENKIQTLC